MTRVVEVPTQFDDRTFDQFAKGMEGPTTRLLFDAHATQWASPYGLVGLLAAGQFAGRVVTPRTNIAISIGLPQLLYIRTTG